MGSFLDKKSKISTQKIFKLLGHEIFIFTRDVKNQ